MNRSRSARIGTFVGVGVAAGVAASVITGQWWLVAVGLALGAGISATRRG